jgi:hypothetical protein
VVSSDGNAAAGHCTDIAVQGSATLGAGLSSTPALETKSTSISLLRLMPSMAPRKSMNCNEQSRSSLLHHPQIATRNCHNASVTASPLPLRQQSLLSSATPRWAKALQSQPQPGKCSPDSSRSLLPEPRPESLNLLLSRSRSRPLPIDLYPTNHLLNRRQFLDTADSGVQAS